MKRYDILDFGAKAGTNELQTDAFQAALDAARDACGGVVTVPAGRYVVAALRIYSDTTLYLCSGAELLGSTECEDYALFAVPEGMELRTDVEMIPQYDPQGNRAHYRRAILSAYGEKNIAVIGEENSVIDGRDCYDANGEEGYRGPHGIFFSNCHNVTLKNYTIQNTGNFMHQLDQCSNVTFSHVSMLAGHDGAHIHCCENVLFEHCTIQSGDDCIAGIDTRNVTVHGCLLNSACNNMRIGGVHLHVEDCRFVGPGVYPHRASIPHGKDDHVPVTEGRHNTVCALTYFSSETYPAPHPAGNWTIKNCTIENVDRFLCFLANNRAAIHSGVPLVDLQMQNVRITGLLMPSEVCADEKESMTIRMKQVSYRFRDGCPTDLRLFDENCRNLTLVETF